jgi:hypothetical protein
MESTLLRIWIFLLLFLPLSLGLTATVTTSDGVITTPTNAYPSVTRFPGCTGYCEGCASSVQADYFSTWYMQTPPLYTIDLNLAGQLFVCNDVANDNGPGWTTFKDWALQEYANIYAE